MPGGKTKARAPPPINAGASSAVSACDEFTKPHTTITGVSVCSIVRTALMNAAACKRISSLLMEASRTRRTTCGTSASTPRASMVATVGVSRCGRIARSRPSGAFTLRYDADSFGIRTADASDCRCKIKGCKTGWLYCLQNLAYSRSARSVTRSTIVVLSTWTMDWLIVTTARAATKPVPGEDTLGRDRLTPGHANGCIPCASCIQGGLYLHSIWTWHVKKSARHIKRCDVRTRMYGVVWPA